METFKYCLTFLKMAQEIWTLYNLTHLRTNFVLVNSPINLFIANVLINKQEYPVHTPDHRALMLILSTITIVKLCPLRGRQGVTRGLIATIKKLQSHI